jgi:hypothetical protein
MCQWVGCTLFLMILHSFLIYLHVTWMSQEDQGLVIHCSSIFHCFCWGGCYSMAMAQLCEFCFVSHDLLLTSNLYICRLKGLMRREVCASRFLRISLFLAMGCYSMARHNSVSFASFFMILCLFLIYVSVVWRARWDERPALYSSSAFNWFCQGGVIGIIWWVFPHFSWSCAHF